MPSDEFLRSFYQGDESLTSAKSVALDDPAEQERETRRRIRTLRKLGFNLERVFELGPGRGYLARALVAQGSKVAGLERHAIANQELRAFGVHTVRDLAEVSGEFDTIILWGVIEHLPDPAGTLRDLTHSLAAGGALAILTEDSSCLIARLAGRRWGWLLPPEHTVLFSRRGMELCSARLGFRLDRDLRWPVDVRSVLNTILGYSGSLKYRERFREARRSADQRGSPIRRQVVRLVKRAIDAKLPGLSEHRLYRFSLASSPT